MKLRACLFLALVACGGDGGSKTPDAAVQADAAVEIDATPDAAPDAPVQQYDFSCMGNAAPTTAPTTMTLSGTAQNFNTQTFSAEPVAGATVRTRTANEEPIAGATTTTDAQGNFSVTVANQGGMPVDGYLEATKEGSRTVRLYPAGPIHQSLSMIPILLLTNVSFAAVQQFAGKPQSAANGTVGLAVLDCANMPIEGATISVKQNNVEYADAAHTYDASALQPGAFLVFDVPPGDVEVNATYNGMPLRAHMVRTAATTTTTTYVRPGY